ncbi:MAG: methyltransferase domain-containing protein [Oscillospiraceae bacterium]
MDLFYQTYIAREDQIYQSMPRRKPISGQVDPPELEFGVDWLCHGAHSVLDFGCGNGSLLFACAYRGVERLVGIDLSREAVALARWAGEDLPQCQFLWGSVEKLMELPDTSFDGIVLSNILDNLKPTDSRAVLQETIRLLQPEGKVLIKLNPYLTREQIEAWGVRTIEGDLLDDGLLLGTGRRKPGKRNSSGISGRSGSRMCIFRNTISTIACSCVKHCKTRTNRRKTMWELYEKSTEKLELNRVLELLADCAGSGDGKAACRALCPSSDLEEVRELLEQTTAACTMSAVQGSPGFYDVKNVDAALERADRGGSLSTTELLRIAGVLRSARTVKGYWSEEETAQVLTPLFQALTPNKYLEDRISGAICQKRKSPTPPAPPCQTFAGICASKAPKSGRPCKRWFLPGVFQVSPGAHCHHSPGPVCGTGEKRVQK